MSTLGKNASTGEASDGQARPADAGARRLECLIPRARKSSACSRARSGLLDILAAWVPITHRAFMDYRMGGATISAKGLAIVKRMIAGEKLDQESSGMSKGEWREFAESLGLLS